MDTRAVIAVIIFVATFAGILSEKVHKTIAALLGGMAMVALQVISERRAYEHIDLAVIFLLAGMMIIVEFLARSGFFGYVAIRLAQIARGRPIPLMMLLCVVTAGLSALVDNVTTVLLIAPVTFLVAEQLEVSPVPYILFEALASNIGGTATLIGDPPNILIGSAAGLGFNDFLLHLTPITAVCLLALLLFALPVIRKQAFVPYDIRARVMEMKAGRAIEDPVLLRKSGTVLAAVLGLFLLHDTINVPPAVIAMIGAAVLALITRSDPTNVFKTVEWPTLFFFIGLFMTVGGLAETGVLATVTHAALSLTGGSLTVTSLVLLWVSGLAAALVGNIPVVTALIPVVESIIEDPALTTTCAPTVLWWSLALGACLGGNGTMFGAAANVVVVEIARRNRRPISYREFLRYGAPVTGATLLIACLYVWLRYCL